MQINLFSIPIFVDNIDASKINFDNLEYKNNFKSNVKSSFGTNSQINKESMNYLIETIGKNIFDFLKQGFKLEIINVWQNFYDDNDFQEKHIHVHSDFSFIVFKKIEESKTVFIAPHSYITESFYYKKFLEQYFQTHFQPKCRKNQIIIFPSFLEHMVKTTNNALTISGNILVKNNE
jgi:hypothetical protein